MNDKFKELSKSVTVPGDSKIMDYNYYVDEILQITPNLIYEKPAIDELTKDPEIMTVYSAYKHQSKIISNNCEEAPIPILKKLDSVLSGLHEPVEIIPGTHVVSATTLSKIDSLCDAYLNQNHEDKEED